MPSDKRDVFHVGHSAIKLSFLALSASIMMGCSSTGEEPSADDPTMTCETSKPRPLTETGKPFESLEAYLKFRKSQGAFDRPFYEKQDDGRYKLNRGRGERFAEPVFYTRAELEAKYGFDCPS